MVLTESEIRQVVDEYRKYVPASLIRLLKKFNDSVLKAIDANHRRMIVLCGEDVEYAACSIARTILSYLRNIKKHKRELLPLKILYMLHRDFPKERVKSEIVARILKEETKDVKLTIADYSETEEYLGTTFDILIMDLTDDLKPNDLGRLIGIVRGGGIIILNPPEWSTWENKLTLFQKELATPQHPEEEVRNIFIRWVKRKLMEHNGIFIYDLVRKRTLKTSKDVKVRKKEKKEIKIPEKTVFPRKLYELALTQDQVNVVKILEEFIERPRGERKKILVLTADRGRGKSCALGIGVAGLIHELRRVKHRVRVLVTAPSLINVQSFMNLAIKSLETLGLKPRPIMKRGRVLEIQGERYSIEYWEPVDVVNMKADIVVVDEAAGLQVPMLHRIWDRHKRILFSSTIHGYEGAGRGFSIRFLKAIKEDKRAEIIEYEMEEPIRYSEDDPIERWQFDTLLLDAEPAELTREDHEAIAKGEFVYVKPDLEKWFSKEGEKELKQFFGIYVLAHYRNQPDDLGMMADAPHHTIRALKLKTGKIVCSVQLAEEGPIPEDMVDNLLLGGRIPGNIIPDRFLKHIRIREFAKTVGWRIVRIATHPQVMSRGIGSEMLKRLIEEAKERGYDWVGAGFGVNDRLLKFWIKNGFIPIHISPDRNPVSGEYTVIVVYPLNKETEDMVKIANREFRIKLLNSLHDNYRDLELNVAYQMLKYPPEPITPDYKPKLTPIQWDRLRIYSLGPMTYEAACDIIYELAKTYFTSSSKPELSELEEKILLMRVLQANSWGTVADELNVRKQVVMTTLKDIAKKFLKYYNMETVKPGINLKEATTL